MALLTPAMRATSLMVATVLPLSPLIDPTVDAIVAEKRDRHEGGAVPGAPLRQGPPVGPYAWPSAPCKGACGMGAGAKTHAGAAFGMGRPAKDTPRDQPAGCLEPERPPWEEAARPYSERSSSWEIGRASCRERV